MYNYNSYPKTTQQQPIQQYPQSNPQAYGWPQQQAPVQMTQPVYGWQPPQQTAAAGLKGRPVSSFDEARVSIIDFDGSVFYFPDLANGKIYTKQINMDGTATTNVYALTEIPMEQQNRVTPPTDCISREEFEQAMASLRNTILAALPQEQKKEVKTFM